MLRSAAPINVDDARVHSSPDRLRGCITETQGPLMTDTRLPPGGDRSLNIFSLASVTCIILRNDSASLNIHRIVPMPILTPRTFTLITAVSLGGYLMIKSRSLAEQRRENIAGDYSVRVERSGGGI